MTNHFTLLGKVPKPFPVRDLPSADDEQRPRTHFERVAGPDHQVGLLAGIEAPQPVGEAQDLGGGQGDAAQRHVLRQAFPDGKACAER